MKIYYQFLIFFALLCFAKGNWNSGTSINHFLEGDYVDVLTELIVAKRVSDKQMYYNGNMDASFALAPRGRDDPEFLQRVQNVVSVFCPDPIFEGWVATGNVNGSIEMYARYRDSPSELNTGNLSVLTIYRDLLPFYVFLNSSQHHVGMPEISVYTDENDVLHAQFNGTLHQSVLIITNTTTMETIFTDIYGHYSNTYMLYQPPAEPFQEPKRPEFCMKKFNSFNAFSKVSYPGTYQVSEQNAVNAQLTVFSVPQ